MPCPRTDAIRPSPQGASANLRHVRQALPHDSGIKHVQGTAHYIDDIREPDGTLHVAIGQSPIARGRLLSLDLDRGARLSRASSRC